MYLTTRLNPRHGGFTKSVGGSFALACPFSRSASEGFFMSTFRRVYGRGVICGTVSGTREGRGFPTEPSSTVSLFLCDMKRPNTKSVGGL